MRRAGLLFRGVWWAVGLCWHRVCLPVLVRVHSTSYGGEHRFLELHCGWSAWLSFSSVLSESELSIGRCDRVDSSRGSATLASLIELDRSDEHMSRVTGSRIRRVRQIAECVLVRVAGGNSGHLHQQRGRSDPP